MSCGCSGSRTAFDRQAALLKEKGDTGPYTGVHTQYGPRYTSSHSVDGRLIWLFVTAVIALVVRIDNLRRIGRNRRTRAILRARAAEAGVELPERIAETLPLHAGGPEAVQTEQ